MNKTLLPVFATAAFLATAATACTHEQQKVALPTDSPSQAPSASPDQEIRDRYQAYMSPSTAKSFLKVPASQLKTTLSEWLTGKALKESNDAYESARKKKVEPRGSINVTVTKVSFSSPSNAVVLACLDRSGYSLVNTKTGKVQKLGKILPFEVHYLKGGDGRWRIATQDPGSQSC